MKQILFTLLILFSCTFLNAQINPPDFICVENDTLFWTLPTNNCGPFVSYEIYVSDFPTGPFILLDEVTNESSTSYFPGNQGSTVQYYYLISIVSLVVIFLVNSYTFIQKNISFSTLFQKMRFFCLVL